MQTYAVAPRLFFWVSKLNILDGLFLEPSASTVCVGVCMFERALLQLFRYLQKTQALTYKVIVSLPRGSSAARCGIKEVIIITDSLFYTSNNAQQHIKEHVCQI